MTWYSITPTWEGNAEQIRQGLPFNLLAPIWQMFLLGDGAPTRHLQLLTQTPIVVDVVAMTEIGDDHDGAPPAISLIPAPRIRRQIWLRSATNGEVYSHATSWWSAAAIADHLRDPSLPIWASLNQRQAELYRDLRGIRKGYGAAFTGEQELWSRDYLLWQGGRPLTLIYEVYAPILAKYLGPSQLS
ncbi:MAG: chorismate lyase [Pseudanabaenaceae cyanobacterium bins.68]|nr:chorismate lyase [Pseudanabaenaceae cyanobacterium bins.68]